MKFNKKDIKIYIICGKAGVGKSSLANYLASKLHNSITLAYASYLKDYAKNILLWDGNEEEKPREFLQQLGVELIKNQIDDKFLIRRMIEDIKVYSYFFENIIISDARFKNEIEDIVNNFDNVKIIHVTGESNNLTEEQKKHATETSLDDYHNYDYEIENDYSEDFYKKVDGIL